MRIRTATNEDAGSIAQVHVESWRTTYRGIVPDSVLDSLTVERRETFWENILSDQASGTMTLVAENDAGEIVGFASGGQQREADLQHYDGELYAIYLLESAQRQGIGRQLVLDLVSRLYQGGFQRLIVWVLKDNPAGHFYEALGGKLVTEKTVNIGGVDLIETAYGWEDISKLLV